MLIPLIDNDIRIFINNSFNLFKVTRFDSASLR